MVPGVVRPPAVELIPGEAFTKWCHNVHQWIAQDVNNVIPVSIQLGGQDWQKDKLVPCFGVSQVLTNQMRNLLEEQLGQELVAVIFHDLSKGVMTGMNIQKNTHQV